MLLPALEAGSVTSWKSKAGDEDNLLLPSSTTEHIYIIIIYKTK